MKENKKSKWGMDNEKFRLYNDESILGDNSQAIILRVFVNKETGEVRLYQEAIVEKIGIDNLKL